jgi:hypothetical protein
MAAPDRFDYSPAQWQAIVDALAPLSPSPDAVAELRVELLFRINVPELDVADMRNTTRMLACETKAEIKELDRLLSDRLFERGSHRVAALRKLLTKLRDDATRDLSDVSDRFAAYAKAAGKRGRNARPFANLLMTFVASAWKAFGGGNPSYRSDYRAFFEAGVRPVMENGAIRKVHRCAWTEGMFRAHVAGWRADANQKHTAFHEAGHAVIGRVLDLVCGGASIAPNEAENEAGHAIIADPWRTASEWDRRLGPMWSAGTRQRGLGCHARLSAARLSRAWPGQKPKLNFLADAQAAMAMIGGRST